MPHGSSVLTLLPSAPLSVRITFIEGHFHFHPYSEDAVSSGTSRCLQPIHFPLSTATVLYDQT